jgi:hypothetical protein
MMTDLLFVSEVYRDNAGSVDNPSAAQQVLRNTGCGGAESVISKVRWDLKSACLE